VVAGRGVAMVRAGEDDGASRWPAWLKRCRCVKEEDAWWWPTRRVCCSQICNGGVPVSMAAA